MEIQKDFEDLCASLNARNADYIAVGGYAFDLSSRSAFRQRAGCGGVPVHLSGGEAFVANKRAVGRAKELADIEALGEHE